MHMILQFGKYKGREIEDISDIYYIQWLAKPKYSGGFYKSLHSTDLNWKVPIDIRVEARRVLESSGYVLKGNHWE